MTYEEGLIQSNQDLMRLKDAYSEAYLNWIRLSRKEKNLLAVLMLHAEGSAANREMIAEASEEYRKFCEDISQAEGLKIKTKADFDVGICRYESFRTLVSLKKKEMDFI